MDGHPRPFGDFQGWNELANGARIHARGGSSVNCALACRTKYQGIAVNVIPPERIIGLAAADALARQHLPQFHPAMFKRVGGTRHVNAPDAIFLLADQAARLVGVLLQPGHPVPQGLAVMNPQILGVEAFEAAAGCGAQHIRGMHQLTTRKDIVLDEFRNAAAQPAGLGLSRGDAMVEHQPTRLQQCMDLVEISGQIEASDVLEHADAGYLVVAVMLGYIAVIHAAHFDAPDQTTLGDLPADVRMLVVRQGNADRSHTIALGCMQDQAAPTAANVEKLLVRLEVELATDVVKLGFLSSVQLHVRRPEIRAGIDAPPTQPQAIEIVGHVIVVLDVLAVLGTCVAPP